MAEHVQIVEGHHVIARDGAAVCVRCGIRLPSAMQFNLRECRA